MTPEMKKALVNWRDLNEMLSEFSEAEVKMMFDYELENENRKTFVERLHQRYNNLRIMRERGELLNNR